MFKIEVTESAREDLRVFQKFEQKLIVGAIDEQLGWQPMVETKKRKLLRLNDLFKWELRSGKYRIFYDVDEANKSVKIKAIGWKEHNQLFIRGKEFKL